MGWGMPVDLSLVWGKLWLRKNVILFKTFYIVFPKTNTT